MKRKSSLVIIGYSGHAFVCIDIAIASSHNILGYCDIEKKNSNPYDLDYLGHEMSNIARETIQANNYFVGIGQNMLRDSITNDFARANSRKQPISLIAQTSIISPLAEISRNGVLINSGAIINSLASIKEGVILNTSSVIEHECKIDSYAHIAPGAVLAGNVTIGKRSFIGANSVIKQGITIGSDVTIGAGSVVLFDIPSGSTAVGNPAKIIKVKKETT